MTCPNINLTEWKNLVNIRGENIAYYLWDFYKGEVPEHEYLQINTTPYIKSGVSELFESNPELANTVYEALEFKTNSLQAFKDNLINIIGVDKVKELYAGTDVEFNSFTIDDVELGTDKSLIVTIKTDKGQRTAINLRLDGDYQYLKISEGNKTVKGIYAPLSEKKTAIDFLINEFKNLNIQEATPQQKQQAQQLYSQYLDTIFSDSKVKDIVYHGSNQKINQFEVKKEPLIHFGSKNAALQRGDVLNPVLLNIENLEIIKDGMWFLGTDEGGLLKELLDRNILTVEQVKNISEAKNKAIQESPYFHENYRMALPEGEKAGNEKLQEILINKNVGFEYINLSEDRGSVSYAVPSQKQIHILGTKQDIEGFRNFVNLNNSNYIESNDNLIKKYALSGLSAEEIGDILKKNC